MLGTLLGQFSRLQTAFPPQKQCPPPLSVAPLLSSLRCVESTELPIYTFERVLVKSGEGEVPLAHPAFPPFPAGIFILLEKLARPSTNQFQNQHTAILVTAVLFCPCAARMHKHACIHRGGHTSTHSL